MTGSARAADVLADATYSMSAVRPWAPTRATRRFRRGAAVAIRGLQRRGDCGEARGHDDEAVLLELEQARQEARPAPRLGGQHQRRVLARRCARCE